MKIKWGMMMTDGRGKLGGQVASKNRSGSYIRTKVTPANPNTSFQSAVRQRLGTLSAEWGNLTEEQRLAWNEAANSGQWNKTDIFGDAKRPTGKNLFTGLNLVSLETTNTLLLRVPKKANFAQFSAYGSTTAIGDEVSIDVTVSEVPTPGTRWQIEATPPVSAGRYYLKNLFRFLTSADEVTEGVQSLDVTTDYASRFGALQVSDNGQRVGLRIRQVYDGQTTPWLEVSSLVQVAP